MYSRFIGKRTPEKDEERLLTTFSDIPGFKYPFLTADASATATTISVNRLPTGVIANGFYVIIDPWTIECEVRKVTALSGTTLTIAALTYAHSEGDGVIFITNRVLNVKWFGAVGDGTTDDLTAINRATTAASATSGASMIVDMPPGVYLVSDTVDVPNKVILRGAGPIARTGAPGATIQAKSTFSASTPLVQLGDDASNSIYCRLENIGVDGNHYADIGVYSNSINEEAGLIRCTVTDCDTYGVHMDNSSTGLLRNFLLRDLYVLNDTGGGTAIGVYIHGGSSPQRGIDGLTVDGSSFDIGLQIDGCQGATFERIHLEDAADGILIGPNSGCHACSFIGITGHSTLTDMIHIDDATSSSNLTFIGLYKNSATNNINDVVNGNTITASYVNHYTTGDIFQLGDLYAVAWNNYYSSSTVVGFSSMTTSDIYYKKIGNLVFVNFDLVGTSDTTTITFTLPYTATTGAGASILIRVRDSGTWQTTAGWAKLAGSTVTAYKNANSGAWTDSSTKGVQGQFFYETT